jgi:uncharacterized DUF497 family protein
MDFEWDSRKRLANLRKHGLDFSDAWKVFAGLVLTYPDERQNYGETRIRAVGMLDMRAVVIIYTIRASGMRIISMRIANEKEKRGYQERFEAFGFDDGRRH